MSAGAAGAAKRTFLFLQGPSSPIFRMLAARLESAGCRCLRINLNAGDWIFWRRPGALNYRGGLEGWPAYVEGVMTRERVTDLILLGEERPHHQAATQAARRLGIRVFVIEMGYLRPDWVTLEREGMSSNSRFPADPAHILRAGAGLPEPDWQRRYSQTFLAEASYDLLYNLPNVFLWFLYPGYRRHALFHPLHEYWGWIGKLLFEGRHRRAAEACIERLEREKARYFVYPLQLQTDYQLRAHSPYRGQKEAIADVLTSFAGHAPPDTALVVKLHPLDNGLIDWAGFIAGQAAALGLTGRVHVIDGGDLNRLLTASLGAVTVNSTAVLHGIRQGMPVKVLGAAIYDIEGMTCQRPLDAFWTDPARPDPALTDAFFRLVAAAIQVRGNFYSQAGSAAAAEEIAGRLLNGTVNMPDAYADPPPRRKPEKRRAGHGVRADAAGGN